MKGMYCPYMVIDNSITGVERMSLRATVSTPLADFVHTGTYIPKKEVVVEETIRATVIKPNQAIKLRARKETTVSQFMFLCSSYP